MPQSRIGASGVLAVTSVCIAFATQPARPPTTVALERLAPARTITAAECSVTRLGDSVPAASIGEPVSAVTIAAPRWVGATETLQARCEVDGSIEPVDRSTTARPIRFRVWLPADWNGRAVQQGGGGMNGSIPDLSGARYPIGGRSPAQLGFATFGSDSGHQMAGPPDWTLNDEAIKNLGYAQLKKTRDAAMVLMERVYGTRPRYTYFTGTSQGGREALTVAQRYAADYDGVIANVPIVSFSSLMLAPELIRIQEKPLANWVTRAKVNAIRGEFMRQCDGLDGGVDGVINNYVACRAIFDSSQGTPGRRPWMSKRCPGNVDPNPADTTAAACLTDGQISTLEFVYRRYPFATPLANGVKSFGMWVPNTDPSGSGLIADTRFIGQEGAGSEARMHAHLGVLGVTGFLMRNLGANPLDYVEGSALNERRVAISRDLDSTDPDLRKFAARSGRMIVTIGTNDTLASPGAQLDYYQSLLETMGRAAVDQFARLFVIPQAGHGLSGSVYGTDGEGKTPTPGPIASDYERFAYLVSWVERRVAPGKTLEVTAAGRTMPLCSYPSYPRYSSGSPATASSYICTAPD
jgi:feruloyl esterase